ncbi:MAG: hypothetical protein A2Z91_05130 [Deltaproteobacteria bacterium GWA2_38_16]|nr:MAG: hypothetical protein A2Z91_05130 [Deltaproteobacteria bacterium GWA2_38_16]OGQ03163.1 MAG: hypothetical protein A3D19_03860 [Deltaproteobacteria bacterium RIFCSPHIGHO2_02_FULL_38_15]HBQ20414.1 hypothetical protein [Deltaproteobacteria bacterium]
MNKLWLDIHIGLSILGEAFLAVALIVGLIYGIQEKRLKNKIIEFKNALPALEALDKAQYQLLWIGFISLTLGLILGSIWAFHAWGEKWFLEPRELWLFSGWLIYLLILIARRLTGFRGRRAAWYSLVGLLLVLFAAGHAYFEGYLKRFLP